MGARGPKIDLDFAAQVLVDAAMLGDDASARKHNISNVTVHNYRRLSAQDANLSKLFMQKRGLLDTSWAHDVDVALKACAEFMLKAAKEADHKDAYAIKAVADGMKTLAELSITNRILDDRATQEGREEAATLELPSGEGIPIQ